VGRRKTENALNLFAFQDIITGVAGVMLFILLLLVVQLTIRTAEAAAEFEQSPPPSEPDPNNDHNEDKLRQLQDELKRLRQRGAGLLQAEASNLDAQISDAEQELHDLMSDAEDQKAEAESLQSQMASIETTQQKSTVLARRNALRRKLEELETEQEMHAGGKLVAFKSESSGVQELWIVDMRGNQADIFNVESPVDAVKVQYGRFDPAFQIVGSIRDKLQEQTKVQDVVVLLRPSVAGSGSELLDAFRGAGFRAALELLDEDTRVVPPSEASP
jgi:small-conductance mechanosensitive channel